MMLGTYTLTRSFNTFSSFGQHHPFLPIHNFRLREKNHFREKTLFPLKFVAAMSRLPCRGRRLKSLNLLVIVSAASFVSYVSRLDDGSGFSNFRKWFCCCFGNGRVEFNSISFLPSQHYFGFLFFFKFFHLGPIWFESFGGEGWGGKGRFLIWSVWFKF